MEKNKYVAINNCIRCGGSVIRNSVWETYWPFIGPIYVCISCSRPYVSRNGKLRPFLWGKRNGKGSGKSEPDE